MLNVLQRELPDSQSGGNRLQVAYMFALGMPL